MDGIIIVNKEKGYTSRDVVNIIAKKFNTKKVGHTGTLDPISEGVLVICLNKALKIASFITSYEKEYIATVDVGYETDTLDTTGKIMYKNDVKITRAKLEEVLKKFKGKIKQEVPIYSSIKVNGKKLYEYARAKQEVKLPIREVNISNIELLSTDNDDNIKIFKIKVNVSKGTYIRSLIRDIGRSLNTYASMSGLIRTKVDKFEIENAYTLEDIKNDKYEIISIDKCLDLPTINICEEDMLKKIKNGCIIPKFFKQEKVLFLDEYNNAIAIYEKDNQNDKMARIVKMINNC